MNIKYSFANFNENMARAYGRNLGISTKQSIEICNSLRGKPLQKAIAFLEAVKEKKQPVRLSRFNQDTAHRRGMGPGRYPINAATEILTIVKSAEANALNKGLDSKDLVIIHIAAHKAARPWHFGRQRRRKMKRSHIEVVLEAKEAKKDSPKPKKPTAESKESTGNQK